MNTTKTLKFISNLKSENLLILLAEKQEILQMKKQLI